GGARGTELGRVRSPPPRAGAARHRGRGHAGRPTMAPPRGCPKWLIARAARAAASRAAPVMDRKAGGATRSRALRSAAAGSPADRPVPRVRTVPRVHPDVVARAQALVAAGPREAPGV